MLGEIEGFLSPSIGFVPVGFLTSYGTLDELLITADYFYGFSVLLLNVCSPELMIEEKDGFNFWLIGLF